MYFNLNLHHRENLKYQYHYCFMDCSEVINASKLDIIYLLESVILDPEQF